jgi:methionyl-tRNA formyltransferase
MKIVFVGTVEFSLKILEVLLDINAEVVGVVTDVNRGVNSDYADLQPLCKESKIPVLSTEKINAPDTIKWIADRSPDVIFCFGWSRLIKKELLGLPPMGVVGYHPAELPRNRGRHPLIWALVLGIQKTASTFFFMDESADSGDILSQVPVDILGGDDAGSLYLKIISIARGQIAEIVPALEDGSFQRIPQEHVGSNLWRKRGMKDGEIDWRMSARSIHNLVRGLARPYVGAHMKANGEIYIIWKTKLIECADVENIEPGKVIEASDNSVIIKCGDSCVELLEIEPSLNLKKGDYL